MIGVFDSGIGGLSAFFTLASALPQTDLLYYADTAHLPLGEREENEILTLVTQAMTFFQQKGVSQVLLACGTAGAVALQKCKQKFAFPVYGIIKDGCLAAVQATRKGHIAVIATPATVSAHAYQKEILSLCPTARVTELACPALVTAAEEGNASAVTAVLSPLSHCDADTLILGCTHFPLLRTSISHALPHMRLIDPAAVAVTALIGIANKQEKAETGNHAFFTTGDPRFFEKRAAAAGFSLRAEQAHPNL